MSFWDQGKPTPQPKPWEQQLPQPMVLDEKAMAELQENPEVNIFEEEEEDDALVMSDVNLRLEQGRLYQMVLQGDIFAETNADPRAIRNVQREIRKFVRERMETMVGIRQEQAVQQTIVSSPFNDTEVTVLKMLAFKMSGGRTETDQQPTPQAPPPTPKKDGITSISGNLRADGRPAALPVSGPGVTAMQKNKPAPKPLPAKVAKSAISAEESALQKPIDQMTQEELAAYDAAALARRSKNRAAMPNNLTPHPTPQQLEMMYSGMAQNMAVKLVPPNS